MADIRRLNLNFNMAYPKQAAAWEVLSAVPAGHRMEEICDALLERNLDPDARKIDPSTMPEFDLICAGFPC